MAGAARRTAPTFDRCIGPRERRLRVAKGEAIGPRMASVRRFMRAMRRGFSKTPRARLAAWQARRSNICMARPLFSRCRSGLSIRANGGRCTGRAARRPSCNRASTDRERRCVSRLPADCRVWRSREAQLRLMLARVAQDRPTPNRSDIDCASRSSGRNIASPQLGTKRLVDRRARLAWEQAGSEGSRRWRDDGVRRRRLRAGEWSCEAGGTIRPLLPMCFPSVVSGKQRHRNV